MQGGTLHPQGTKHPCKGEPCTPRAGSTRARGNPASPWHRASMQPHVPSACHHPAPAKPGSATRSPRCSQPCARGFGGAGPPRAAAQPAGMRRGKRRVRGSAERGDPGRDAAIAPTFADAGRLRSGVPSTPLPARAAPLTGHGWFQHREAAAQCQRVPRKLLRVDMRLKLPVSVHPLARQRGLIPAAASLCNRQNQIVP